jgi:PEP-CTERM motif
MKPVLRCVLMLIGLVACGAQATHAAVINDFSGAFAVGNWTITTPTGSDGFVTLNGPTSVIVASGNNAIPGNTDFSITMPFAGTVTFTWSFTTADTPTFDPFFVGSASSFTKLSDDFGNTTQTGTESVSLGAGDSFTFRAYTPDGANGRSETTITNFSVTYADSGAVPEPTSMAIFGLGALGMAYRQRRKTKS